MSSGGRQQAGLAALNHLKLLEMIHHPRLASSRAQILELAFGQAE